MSDKVKYENRYSYSIVTIFYKINVSSLLIAYKFGFSQNGESVVV